MLCVKEFRGNPPIKPPLSPCVAPAPCPPESGTTLPAPPAPPKFGRPKAPHTENRT